MARQIFIELYNYRDRWFEADAAERRGFADMVAGEVEKIAAAGAEVIAFGLNDTGTDRRAGYDFFCVYTLPDAGFARTLEAGIAASGWHDYFEQVQVSGTMLSVADGLAANVGLRMPGTAAS